MCFMHNRVTLDQMLLMGAPRVFMCHRFVLQFEFSNALSRIGHFNFSFKIINNYRSFKLSLHYYFQNTIKHIQTISANDWPECLIKIWLMVIGILRQNSYDSAKAIQLTVKSTLDSMLKVQYTWNMNVYFESQFHWMIKLNWILFFFFLFSFKQSEWHQIDKAPLKNIIIECIPLLQNHPNMLYRCDYIIKNMDDPWSNATFKKIISHNENNENTDEIAGTDQQNEGITPFGQSFSYKHYW